MNDLNRTGPYQPATGDEVAVQQLQRIGRYRIECVLGEGGFGIVYLAHDDQLQRPVAVKVPHAWLVPRPEDAEAYLTEARTVANLDHPNIVPVHDVGGTGEFPCYVVSKYIDGRSLAQWIKGNRPSVTEAVELAATVADALHHAHRKGLVHRDIKPGNILLDSTGKPYVADFGLALREQDVGKGARYAGTPPYMSPEQARGEGHRVDGRSDIFSLGVLLYELLTGRRPFRAESREELLEQIRNVEVRPPRQWDDTIPKELERICLKALAKRASERYTTARDMAEDLRHFLAGAPAEEKSTVTGREKHEAAVATLLPSPAPTPSDQQAVKIVPKGLRSFDAGDADFFLELLPGPRDREGLPDSIRFWKTRIEQDDPDKTFSVGLIYGPSGCGKSSLVKAGVLPRLAEQVLAVYIEATADETEARLLKGLRRQVPDLPGNLGLVESLAALRQGRFLPCGQKVLLVLDQFEQWLHAKPNDESTGLVQALRQCDGGRVQCVVLVRDDFWMAATRFMANLEVSLLQGQNCAAADLFDLLHARKVLAAFGRAYGRLPDNLGHCTEDQNAFLDQAIAGLAEDGKIISVRLALFAEMVKGKPWTPATLKAVGGMQGVGASFLEETFAASTAPPQHRLHQKAAQAVLKALLPEAGTDIKGHMRSHQDLLAASGPAARPKDFDALLRILDGELRLITPTDPEGKDDATPATVRAGAKYYQLTHDYLVPSLREWLVRKQKGTRRGRAELRLAERAALWRAKPENRHLPAWWEWLNIRLLTRKRDWTLPQRKMMRKASRYHVVRGVALAVVLLVVTVSGLVIRGQAIEQNEATHAQGLVRQVLDAEIAQVPGVVAEMNGYRRWTDPLLRDAYDEAERAEREAATQAERTREAGRQLHASLALLPVDDGQAEYLYGRLLDAGPQEVAVIRAALRPHKDELVGRLWGAVERPPRDDEGQRLRAACALAAYDPDSPRWDKSSGPVVGQLVAVNPIVSGYWIEGLRPVKGRLLAPLSAVFRGRGEGRTAERNLATSILADYAADQPDLLADLVQDADERQFAVLFPLLDGHRERAVAMMNETVNTALDSKKMEGEKEALAKRQANAAVVLLRLGQAEKVWPLLRHHGRDDPRVRSYLIHRLSPLGADAGAVVKRLDEEPDVSIRRALILALGEFGEKELPLGKREVLLPKLFGLYRDDTDAGLHGAVEWLLLRWGQQARVKEMEEGWKEGRAKREERIGQIRQTLVKDKEEAQWFVNGQGQTMVVIPGPVEFLMGSPPTEAGREGGPSGKFEMRHEKRIGRSFALAAGEVTVEQFLRSRKDYHHDKGFSPTGDCPVNSVSWYDAVAYCNWLSEQEGIDKEEWCYLPSEGGKYADGMRMAPDYLHRTGYRLPTEAEWEYACRAGSLTSRYYGEGEELLDKYAWYLKNSQQRVMLPGVAGRPGVPGGRLKPNDFGLFDMLGNAMEWCQGAPFFYSPGPGGKAAEDVEGIKDIRDTIPRTLRGGSFAVHPGLVRSAKREAHFPMHGFAFMGFRPARTFR